MTKEWIEWDRENGPYPDERKWVVLLIKSSDNYLPNSLNVGYLRYAAGDKSCPYFVIPGGVKAINCPFIPLAYSEVLPDDFLYPKGYLAEAENKDPIEPPAAANFMRKTMDLRWFGTVLQQRWEWAGLSEWRSLPTVTMEEYEKEPPKGKWPNDNGMTNWKG